MKRNIFLYGPHANQKFFFKIMPNIQFIEAAAYGYQAFYFSGQNMVGLTYSNIHSFTPQKGVLLFDLLESDIKLLDTIYGNEFNRRIIAVICQNDIEHFVEAYIPLHEKQLDKSRAW